MEENMNNALIKSKTLENLFLSAEKKRNEIIIAEEKRAEDENKLNQRRAVQEWAELHLYVEHQLTHDEQKSLFPVVRRWYAKRLARGVTYATLSHGISSGLIVSAFSIFNQAYFLGPVSFVAGSVALVTCVVLDLVALCGEYTPPWEWYRSYIVRPIRFLKHGHCEKMAKPKVPLSIP